MSSYEENIWNKVHTAFKNILGNSYTSFMNMFEELLEMNARELVSIIGNKFEKQLKKIRRAVIADQLADEMDEAIGEFTSKIDDIKNKLSDIISD